MARTETVPGGAAAPPPRRTQQERSAQAGQALLDAAEELFAQRGVDQTSLAELGQVAGYSRGLANHHFGSKAALVDQLAQRIQARFIQENDSAVPAGDPGDVVEVLSRLIRGYLEAMIRYPRTGRAFFVMWGAAIPSEAPLRPVFATDDERFRRGVEELLRAGQANGTVTGDIDPVSTAVALTGMARGVAAQHLIAPDAFDLAAAIEACQRFVERSLAATT
ncbi:TetR/AcrR family transcriptional regulator [Nocardia niigatensis]|uniref:TetR/AcrR family transcriptional regulator n=1 Tax=Nocardia niigatensis TaxID=209249 RepID=UPI000308AC44|nr:TetR family transcriptional regulator [Nocardia niigatensis]